MIGQFKGRQKTNVYGWVSDLAVARSGFNQIGLNCLMNKLSENVASVPVTGNSRKIEASAHLSKMLLR